MAEIKGNITWRCPSNIAIVKYWGKKDDQLPCNASVSMTLSNSFTTTELEISEKKSNEPVELTYYFEGRRNESFENRVLKYLQRHAARFPVLKDHAIKLMSENSFPHSTGIASSASAFGAIALSLLDAGQEAENPARNGEFLKEASELARLGSGSACRSLYPAFSVWGKHAAIKGSSDHFATPVLNVHENFSQMQDAILVVDDQAKEVSSSVGHSLMKDHIYAENRFTQANQNAQRLLNVLTNGDYEEFITIAETEALALHAMMMTSANYYLLMKPGTIHAIQKIIGFRKETRIPVCFTLDAGPNVHILYPDAYAEKVNQFMKQEFTGVHKGLIFDHIGIGPIKIN